MIGHWFAIAWRQLIANPLFSLITIASLSIGCCGALLAGANIRQHLSFEQGYADADRIVLVRMREVVAPGSIFAQGSNPTPEGVFNYSMYPALKSALEGRLPGMVAQARVMTGGPLLADERGEPTEDVTRVVDPEFFDVFEFDFIEGDKATALATPLSLVLTRSKAKELFGDAPALGKEVAGTNKRTFKVSAVISDPPAPTMFEFKALGSFPRSLAPQPAGPGGRPSGPNFDSWSMSTTGGHYIRMADDVDRDAFITAANEFIKGLMSGGRMAIFANPPIEARADIPKFTVSDFEYRISLMPITDIHLAPREATGVTSSADVTMLMTLGAAAAALLAVSAFNYVMLSLARALRRRREVGVRKALGASGGAIAQHYLAEALLVTAISVAAGFGLAELLHPWFARTIGQPDVLFDLYDPLFLTLTAGVVALLALLVGAYPALYLAHVRPRAGLESGGNESFGGFGRFVTFGLLGLQIAAATILLTVALTMAAQSRYIAARPLGFKMANMYSITGNCPMMATQQVARSNPTCVATFDRTLRETPNIKRIAHSSTPSIFTTGDPLPITRPGGGEKLGDGFSMAVDEEFLPMTGAKLLAGRLFDKNSAYDRRQIDAYPTYPAEPFDSVPVVVTRALLPLIGVDTPEEALGKRILMSAGGAPMNLWTKSNEIVGVIEDWHQRSLRHSVAPIIFTPGGTLMYAVAEIEEQDLADVEARLNPVGGFLTEQSYGMTGSLRMTVTPLETAFGQAYEGDRKLMAAIASFAGVAMLVAGLGVFGLSAFDIRRRVREIGIRKALGADPTAVAGMVMGRSLLSAAIASLLAWPLAWWLANMWLQGFVYRTNLGLAVLPVASAIVIAFVALAVTLNAARAAGVRPAMTLRTA